MLPSEHDLRPRLLLGTAILMLLGAVVMYQLKSIDESVRIWGFNTLVKVALVLLTASLAWPQLKRLNGSSYGRVLLIGIVISAGFFLIRPKAMTAILPMIAIAVAVLVAITFLRNLFHSPPNKK